MYPSNWCVHIIYNFQNASFQVLECCWEELLEKVGEASDLDHVIAAHETFLDQVMRRALLDNESRVSIRLMSFLFSNFCCHI